MADQTVPAADLSAPSHDAVTGFHDIKPLPQFSPVPWFWIWTALLFALLLLVLYWLKKRQPRAPHISALPPLTPHEAAHAELRRLELLRRDHRISLRDLASTLSLVLRTYLEHTLSFPAVEQTPQEVTRSLPPALKRALPQLSSERAMETANGVRALLRLLEQFAFAGDSTERYHPECAEVGDAFRRIAVLVDNLHSFLKNEEERTRSVVHDPSAGAS